VTITQPAAGLSASTTQINVLCFGNSTGSVDLTVSGGTSPYTYLWNNNATTQDLSSLAAGTYSVTVTDANGCTTTSSVNITEPVAGLSASIVGTNVLCYGNSTGAIDVTTSGGTIPYSYLWDNSATSEDISNLIAGNYSLTITDANNCTYSLSVSITQPTQLIASASSGSILCNGGTTTLTVTAIGGIPSYTNVGTYTVSAGAYTYTVTDANGCSDTAGVVVNQNSGITATASITPISCNGGSNGAIDITPVGGVSPYSYSWSNTLTTEDISGLVSGTYSVEIKDTYGCTGTATFTVNQPAALSATLNTVNVNCFGTSTGMIYLTVSGGTGTKTYLWSTGSTSQNLLNVPAGSYSVTITDANGCTLVKTATITQNPAIVFTSTITPVSCNGFSDGGVAVNVNGGVAPYTYSWTGGGSQSSISNVSSGLYTLSVVDNLGCIKNQTFNVTQPAPLSINIVSVSGAQCSGSSTGSADISVSGGTPSYSYSWSNGATTEDLINVPAGSYTLTVTDSKGCVNNTIVTITTAPSLVATATATPILCNGGTSNITVSATGGTPAYSGTGTFTVTVGTYSYTVTDNVGCTSTVNISVTEPTLLTASVTTQSVTCNGQSNGSATVTPSGGTSPYTYLWTNGSTNASSGSLSAGNYTVSVTDNNGCTISQSVSISQPNGLSISGNPTNPLCHGGSTGSIDISVSGGSLPYSYMWTPNNQTTEDISNLSAGSQTVQVTDANGCTQTSSFTLTAPSPITISASVTPATCGNNDGEIDITVLGGTLPYTYDWSNSSNAEDQTSLVDGTYSVSVTDLNGCIENQTYTVGLTGGSISSISGPVIVCDYIPPGPMSTQLAKYTANTSCGSPTAYQWIIPPSNSTFAIVGPTTTKDLQVQYFAGFSQATFTVNVTFGSVVVTETITASAIPLPPNVSGSVCGSSASNNTYNVIPAYSGVTYNWTVPYGTTILSGQGGPTMVLKFSAYYTGGILEVTADNQCGTSDPTTISLLKSPDKPTSITGTTPFCIGSQIPNGVSFTCTQVPTATYYFWTAPNGASVVSGQLNNTANILFNSNFISGNIAVQAGNQCGTSPMTYLTVSSQTISPSGPISGPTNVCQYLGSGTATYSVAPVSGTGITYAWTPPSGATIISGQGTNSVTMSFATSFVSGNLSLVVGNYCGFSPPTNLGLSLTNIYPVGQISGATNVCTYATQGTVTSYSVAPVPGASTYNWSVPFGATITAGQGTNVIQVTYQSNFVSGVLSVSVASYCGTGTTTNSINVFVVPSNAGNIFGSPCIGIGNVTTFSVNPVSGVTSYNWTVPSGATIQSGQGTNSINVLFGVGFLPGNITVTPVNSCGSGTPSSKPIDILASAPTQIFGQQVVCNLAGTGLTTTYSVSAVPGATSYFWGQVNGMNIISGQNTATITVTFNSTFISGNISCMAVTPCGSSPYTYYTVSKVPLSTNNISGVTNVCQYVGSTSSVTYSTTPISGVSNYIWSVSNPALMQITGGQGTSSLSVKYLSGFTSGSISCQASTGCGNAPANNSINISCPSPINQVGNSSNNNSFKFYGLKVKTPSCKGSKDGEVSWSIEGGVQPIKYILNGENIGNENKINEMIAGHYQLIAVDSKGDSAKTELDVNEPDTLNAKVDLSADLKNIKSQIILNVSGGTPFYEFSINGGRFEILDVNVNGLVEGINSILIKDVNGCENEISVNIGDRSAIKENEILNVYPVPANNEIHVRFNKHNHSDCILQVVSADGKIIYQDKFDNENDIIQSINTSEWPQGTYFVQMIKLDDGSRSVKEIIIQH
ncbi:MAG: T9SS type A sorting domain-containing protein, partial [Bacteroidota bacterium]